MPRTLSKVNDRARPGMTAAVFEQMGTAAAMGMKARADRFTATMEWTASEVSGVTRHSWWSLLMEAQKPRKSGRRRRVDPNPGNPKPATGRR